MAKRTGLKNVSPPSAPPTPIPKLTSVQGSARARQKVHAGRYIHDAAYDIEQHDLGPWMETPSSSRVSRFRYDYQNRAVQVQWRNNRNQGYIYLDVPYEGFRSMARVSSKGMFINSNLNNYEYRPLTDEELDAPSNPDRRGLISRIRE